jgi:hypothetical protein
MVKRSLLVILWLSTIAALTPALSQPTLQVSEGKRLNFGRIPRGTVFEKTLTLKNSGTETLTLDHVEASCGCTATVLSDKRIPPGKSGSLLIKFNSEGLSGSVYKNIVVVSDASDAPRTTIEFSATVVDEITFTPDQLSFQDARPGKKYSLAFVMRNEGTDTLFITSFRTKVQGLTLQFPSGPIAPKQSVNLVADFTPKTEVPVIADRIIIRTSSRRQPDATIPVYGSVKEFRFDEVGHPEQ